MKIYYSRKNKEFLDDSDYDVEYTYEEYLDAIDGKIKLSDDCIGLLDTKISNPDILFDYELISNSKNISCKKQIINK